eukprot:GDKH01024331.1.p3 GENE.GDKH01024331.1~~GDKH01024331.1.p3  ORF type:complete len:55 (-),score=5.02 GDKH01024331.1:102-266(-)
MWGVFGHSVRFVLVVVAFSLLRCLFVRGVGCAHMDGRAAAMWYVSENWQRLAGS